MRSNILVYPHDPNPYQELLYRRVQRFYFVKYLIFHTKSRPINLMLFPFQIICYRLLSFSIFHLHWLYGFTLLDKNYISVIISNIYFYLILIYIKICGFRIVWTIHNWLPHEKTFLDDYKTSTWLSKICDAIIVLNREDRKILINQIGILPEKIHYIPIANYIKVYKKKHIKKDKNININFFGLIREYKGLENLISVFNKLELNNVVLRINGKCTDSTYFKKLESLTVNNKNVELKNIFLSDDKLAEFIMSSDIIVLPFLEVTNSSSAVLAFSMKKTIIAPRIGAIKDFPETTGIYYDPNDPDGLKNAILKAVASKDKLSQLGMNAFKYISQFTWEDSAKKTVEVYKSLYV